MDTYELIIERRQPPCGGKPPKLYEFLTVQTENPEAYVRSREPEGERTVMQSPNGELIISVGEGLKQVRYCFTRE
ncbi:MAG: hypothetical protein ACI3V5_08775 [Faecousia sp.]